MLLQVRRKPLPIGDDLRAMLERVAEPAILIAMNHEILAANTAYRKKYGDVGRSCYSASRDFDSPCDHNGEPCPLRATLESGRRQRVFHIQHGAAGPRYVDVEVEPIIDDRGQVAYFLERILEIDEARDYEGELVGRATSFLRALGLLQRAAPSEVPVLILGESGTGKELAARALHQMSPRRHRPFMPVECSGLPETLFESELFGYEQGAFTGANKSKRGLVSATAGGTLFLDEIGDVPLLMQVKLLRAIERHEVTPVGDSRPRVADFRVIAATHRPLTDMVAAGEFREDLLYRLSVFHIHLPPLRNRREDIPLLAEYFLQKFAGEARPVFTDEALTEMTNREWRGNVRELRNAVEHAAIVARGRAIHPEHLPPPVTANSPAGASLEERIASEVATWVQQQLSAADPDAEMLDLYDKMLAVVEPPLLEATLAHTGGNRATAARLLGIHRTTLRQKLREGGAD